MTPLEKIELTVIVIITGIIAYFANGLPTQISLGQLLLNASMLLLLQGLVRDVALIVINKRKNDHKDKSQQTLQCLCFESGFGMLGIIIGGILLLSGIGGSLTIDRQLWSVLFFVITLFGFLIKDYIFTWNPFSIKKEKDHHNVIFSFKK
jgi:phage shock protein PspC (stress-responsive transcriptional regulator)